VTETDWKELLKKYMQHVVDCEGTTFLRESFLRPEGYMYRGSEGSFDPEDWEALKQAEKEQFDA